jgi:hypothetical protein
LDSLAIGSFQPKPLSNSSQMDLDDQRRVSTIDEILQRAESLLSD